MQVLSHKNSKLCEKHLICPLETIVFRDPKAVAVNAYDLVSKIIS